MRTLHATSLHRHTHTHNRMAPMYHAQLSSYGNVGATQPDSGNMEAMMSEILARGPIT